MPALSSMCQLTRYKCFIVFVFLLGQRYMLDSDWYEWFIYWCQEVT